MEYTKDKRVERMPPIRLTSSWNWPCLAKAELKSACSARIKGKTPGPDNITQEIICQAYKAVLTTFYKLYASLLKTSYYP